MQSTETDQTTRPDIGELISEGQDMIEDHDYDMTGWARQIITALAAERDRADRAEAALTNAPHQRRCLSLYEFKDRLSCDCWKSEATA